MTDNAESTITSDDKPAAAALEAKAPTVVGRGDVIIHIRFHPNGRVNTVNHQPDGVSPQDWFDLLCRRAEPSAYQALAGGRGAFRIPSDVFDAIWQDREI